MQARPGRPLLAPVLLLAGVAAACGPEVSPGLPLAAEQVADVARAADGEHLGFLTAVTTHPPVVTIDPAVWVDDDAEPNGFRIEDAGVPVLDLPVAGDAVIEIFRSTGDPGTVATVTVAELAEWFAGRNAPVETAPFDVTVVDGEVIELRFVYRP